MSETFKVNSESTLKNCHAWIDSLFGKYKQFRLKPTFGEKSTFDQHSLLHVWISKWILDKTGKKSQQVQVERFKRSLKELAYVEGFKFVLEEYLCSLTGLNKKRWKSISEFNKSELTSFLDFIQFQAAKDGVILEAQGDYKKIKEKQNS